MSSARHGMFFLLKTAPSHGKSEPPSITCFLGPILVHNPNGISIGSAIFAQVTAHGRVTWDAPAWPFPQNCPFAREIWTPSNTCFLIAIRVHTLLQRISWSVWPFVYISRQNVIGHVGACPSPSILPLPTVRSGPHLIHGSVGQRDSASQTTSQFSPLM